VQFVFVDGGWECDRTCARFAFVDGGWECDRVKKKKKM